MSENFTRAVTLSEDSGPLPILVQLLLSAEINLRDSYCAPSGCMALEFRKPGAARKKRALPPAILGDAFGV